MQPAQDRFGMDGIRLLAPMARAALLFVGRCGRRIRNIRPEGHVRATGIIVTDPRTQDRPQMRLGKRNQPIQTLAADGADHSLANGVRLRAARWRFQHVNTEAQDRCIQMLGDMLSRS
jgi:hypothetical protein